MKKTFKIPRPKRMTTGQDDIVYNGNIIKTQKPVIIEDTKVGSNRKF